MFLLGHGTVDTCHINRDQNNNNNVLLLSSSYPLFPSIFFTVSCVIISRNHPFVQISDSKDDKNVVDLGIGFEQKIFLKGNRFFLLSWWHKLEDDHFDGKLIVNNSSSSWFLQKLFQTKKWESGWWKTMFTHSQSSPRLFQPSRH